jgi:hypothetical protein
MYYPGAHVKRAASHQLRFADMTRKTKRLAGTVLFAVIPADAGIHFRQSSWKRVGLRLISRYGNGRIDQA